ncbi:hypothetical protein ACHAWF_002784 [Thalassiosira exigua]
MSSSTGINKNVNVERRTWDREAYEARARSRAAAEEAGSGAPSAPAGGGDVAGDASATAKAEIDPVDEKQEFLPAQQGRAGPMGSQRAFLKSRSRRVDLESKLGSTEIIDPAAASATRSKAADATVGGALTPASGVTKCSDGVGWHCRVCDCFLKDSLTYLDHINGRKHQRYLGYSMRVEKSTTEEVSGVLKGLAEKKREREGVLGLHGRGGASSESMDFEDVVRKKDEDALRRKAERARRREERKRKEKEELNGSDQLNVAVEVRNNGNDAAGERNPAQDDEEEVDDGEMDPDLAAMMGFSGFGGSLK